MGLEYAINAPTSWMIRLSSCAFGLSVQQTHGHIFSACTLCFRNKEIRASNLSFLVVPVTNGSGWLRQVLINGYTYGGLSEVLESEFLSCSMGSTIAGEIGVFGHKPSMLLDMLAGKRAEVGTKVGAYMRTFSGDCSPSDLETALQVQYMIYGDHTSTSLRGFSQMRLVVGRLIWKCIST